MMTYRFPATRAEGLARLAAFVPLAGHDYAAGRNTDNGPEGQAHVSLLSPYLRHRLITEPEVVRAVLARHSLSAAEKFIQEVLWRTYWKGWLELRPAVWQRFVDERDRMRAGFPDARAIVAAENGMTGIDGFDDWARELVETGYLHNHARMWFASIWIFTLRLPWTLGADFFMRHLIDADPASNTLSWRWVAGLQTAGKTYLATADNIARFTGGRFAPKGLARTAAALTEAPIEAPNALPPAPPPRSTGPSLLLVTAEDMSPETLFCVAGPISAVSIMIGPGLSAGEPTKVFAGDVVEDTACRLTAHYRCQAEVSPVIDAAAVIAAAQNAEVRQVVTAYAPVGPTAAALREMAPTLGAAGINLCQARRSWDTRFWPHAKKGFFAFKEQIPAGLTAEGLAGR